MSWTPDTEETALIATAVTLIGKRGPWLLAVLSGEYRAEKTRCWK
jgi:hypothetical protein